jgi:tetratricopeptide (TPR) repeat protein
LKLEPASQRARDGIVAADLAAHDVDAARARVHDWLAERPNDEHAEQLAARIDLARNDTSAAEARLLHLMQRTPATPDAYDLLGTVYIKEGHLDQALAKYRELASRDKTDDFPLTVAGMILEAMGKRAEARTEYEAALARNPRAGVAANNLAWMLAQDGQLDQALTYALTAVDQLHNQPQPYDTLGWVYLHKRLAGHAETEFRHALDLAPQNETYKKHLQLARDAIR